MNKTNIIKFLIRQALSGELQLPELYRRWPEELVGEFFEKIFDDIEAAVEHFPARKNGDGDIEYFKSTIEYKLLLDDLIALNNLNPGEGQNNKGDR